jgi:S-methylmethionine-dependent homocysteine/selenocysteine methylase
MPAIPKLGGSPFLTDAGLETCMVFKQGLDLPCFSSFVLLDNAHGRAALEAYYRGFLNLADQYGAGFVLDSPTWRSNPDWGAAVGYDQTALDRANREAIAFIAALRSESTIADRVVLNAVIGPRGDGYSPDTIMTAAEARDYHSRQIAVAADAGADMASAITMNYVEEAQGIAAAAADAGVAGRHFIYGRNRWPPSDRNGAGRRRRPDR